MGETTTRFFRVVPRTVKGVNMGGIGRCSGARMAPARSAIQSS
jgi:hypothetical protein